MQKIIYILFLILSPTLLYSQGMSDSFRQGTRQLEAGNYQQAIDKFNLALSNSPTPVALQFIYANLGLAQQNMGLIKEAIESYTQSLKQNPTSTTVLLQRANVYLLFENYEKAISDYSRVLEIKKNSIEALQYRAYSFAQLKQYVQAAIDYSSLLKYDPQNPQGRFGLALLHSKEGHINESLMLLEQLIEDYPNQANYYVARSEIQRNMGFKELALMDIDTAIKIDGTKPSYYVTKSELLIELTRKKEASHNLDKAIELGENASTLKALYKRCK